MEHETETTKWKQRTRREIDELETFFESLSEQQRENVLTGIKHLSKILQNLTTEFDRTHSSFRQQEEGIYEKSNDGYERQILDIFLDEILEYNTAKKILKNCLKTIEECEKRKGVKNDKRNL